MMPIVIDDQSAAARPLYLTQLLQPPVDALELRQCALNRGIGQVELGRDGDRGQRVQDIVPAGQVDGHAQGLAAGAQRFVARLQAIAHHIDGANIRLRRKP